MSTCRVNVDNQDCLRCVSSVSEPEDDWLRLGPGSLSKVWADPRRAGESRASEEVPVSFHRSPSPDSGSGPQPRLRLRPIASSGWAPTPGTGQTLRHDTNNIIYIRHHLKPVIRINIKLKFQYHNTMVAGPCVVLSSKCGGRLAPGTLPPRLAREAQYLRQPS